MKKFFCDRCGIEHDSVKTYQFRSEKEEIEGLRTNLSGARTIATVELCDLCYGAVRNEIRVAVLYKVDAGEKCHCKGSTKGCHEHCNFARVTKNPEMLAEFLTRTVKLHDGRVKWVGKTEPFQTFENKSEAIAATIAWLKQEGEVK